MTNSRKSTLIYLAISLSAFISVAVVNYFAKNVILVPGSEDYAQTNLILNLVMLSDFFVGLVFLVITIINYKKEI